MFPMPLKTFVHPHEVYQLAYPSHWDQVTEKDGASCGFGPHDRDDVGLWISIMALHSRFQQTQRTTPRPDAPGT